MPPRMPARPHERRSTTTPRNCARLRRHGLLEAMAPARAPGGSPAIAPALFRPGRRLPLLQHQLRAPRARDRTPDRPPAGQRELQRRLLRPLRLARHEPTTSRRGVSGLGPSPPQNTELGGCASGALVSTARDLARFYRALLSGRGAQDPRTGGDEDNRSGRRRLRARAVQRASELRAKRWAPGAMPGFVAHAYASPDGARQVVYSVNGEPQNGIAEAAVNRASDAGLCA